MLRDTLTNAMKDAMRAKDQETLNAVRMILAKLKDADIAARPSGNMNGISEDQILSLLQGMVKQRRESIALYEQGNRQELADKEKAEITVIESFLPKQMDEAEVKAVIAKVIAETGAASVKDMGKVMGALKKDYNGKMDFSAANGVIKTMLAG